MSGKQFLRESHNAAFGRLREFMIEQDMDPEYLLNELRAAQARINTVCNLNKIQRATLGLEDNYLITEVIPVCRPSTTSNV